MSLEARPESTGDDRKSPISSAHVVLIYLVGLRRSLARLFAIVTFLACTCPALAQIQITDIELASKKYRNVLHERYQQPPANPASLILEARKARESNDVALLILKLEEL